MKLIISIFLGLILFVNVKSQSIERVSAKKAFSLVNNRDTVNSILIDGRNAKMYAEKHIKGAINIDAFNNDSLASKLKSYFEKKEIIVYCSNHTRAEIIIKKLKEKQYKGKISFITDGINGWISAGYNVVNIH